MLSQNCSSIAASGVPPNRQLIQVVVSATENSENLIGLVTCPLTKIRERRFTHNRCFILVRETIEPGWIQDSFETCR
jgi:hypothetical protein